MRETIFTPDMRDGGVVVWYTEAFILDKGMKITVPNQYTAVVFDNEKIAFRVEPCVGKVIFKEYGKELLGHTMRIAFVHAKAIPETMWGFGNIQVNNERLREAYRVGANGTYQIEIADYGKLIGAFPTGVSITVESIKERMNALIRSVGIPILGGCFANTSVSVFEVSSLLGDIRKQMQDALTGEAKVKAMGIRITALTVAGIHVNEEDLELIRERINAPEETEAEKETTVPTSVDISADLERFSREISGMITSEIRASERRTKEANEARMADALEENRAQLLDAVMAQIKGELDTFGKSISSEIDEKIQDMFPLQDNAKEDAVKEIKVTAQFLIDNAADDDALIAPAAMIYSNVEENLMKKFHLPHKNKKFIIDYHEYLLIVDKAKIGDRYLLKIRRPDGTYDIFQPRSVSRDRNGSPVTVEMVPIVRFIKAGLPPAEAKKASDIWTVLNRIRHKSVENEAALRDFFEALGRTRKEFLAGALDFYRENGLYTKD